MLRAVSQIVSRRAAATRMTTAATSIQNPHAAHRSASAIEILPGRAAVRVVTPVARPIGPPEAIPLARRTARLLGPQVLPHAVEELDRSIARSLWLDVRPSARHLVGHVPAVLPIGLSIGEAPKPADHHSHALGRERRDDGAGR